MEQCAARAREHASRGQAVGSGHPLAPGGHLRDGRCLPDAFIPVTAPSARSPRPTGGSRPLPLCPVSPPRRPHPEPAPTSRGGAEERAAGGGAVVPGRQLHAVAEHHPSSGGDGPAWGLAAAAAPRHGLPRTAPAARAWPSGSPGPSPCASPRPRPPLPPLRLGAPWDL